MRGEFFHHNHGDTFHNLLIMIGKSIAIGRGYDILPVAALQDKKIYPGIPDIYLKIDLKKGNFKRYVIEVETNPTKASIEKKTAQFQSDGVTELIIIDVRKLVGKRNWKSVKVGEMIDFVELWMP